MSKNKEEVAKREHARDGHQIIATARLSRLAERLFEKSWQLPGECVGRKRHILVDTLGIPIANRVEAASMSDRRAAARLLGGLAPIFPTIKTVIAEAGHQSRKLTSLIKAEGYELRIVKRRKRAFEVVGLTWIVERTFAWISDGTVA